MESAQKRSRGRPRSFNAPPDSNIIQALDRALHILKVLAGSEGMSLSELAEAAGQSPATVYRVLSTYETHGMVEFQPAQQIWFVGQEAFRIGSAFLGRSNLVEVARAIMHDLMARTGETANLAISKGGQVMFLSQVETHEPIRAFFRPGTRSPIHASGIGKALLAWYPADRIDRIIRDEGLEAFTEHTITDRDALLAGLAEIRDRGWALDDEEKTLGMRCVAAPIFNEFREAIAGVSISGPTARMQAGGSVDYGALVREAAARITRAIGGAPGERQNDV
jgi:IclR family acetate operon transcriptional repressor